MVQSITRVFDILEALALADEELSLTQLQAKLNLPPPTLHRLLKALVERGYVEQSDHNRHYGPGVKILEIAEAAKRNSRFNLVRIVRPYLQRLTEESGETSNLVIPNNQKIVYVEQVPSPRRVRMFTEVGHRAPFYCTGAGKAILSCFTEDQLETYISSVQMKQMTSFTLTSIEALQHNLNCVRERGFAVDNEEFELGVRCVAAPITNSTGRCVGAISVSGPATRMSLEQAEELGHHVSHMSGLCSMQLGYGASDSGRID